MKPGIIAQVRDLVPIRPLTRAEAFRIAELQATRFLALSAVTPGAVPTSAIAELPRLQVEHLMPLPASGATQWSRGRWLILLNAAEPMVRRRFSLAHEFKHILDNRFIEVLYQRIPEADRTQFIEQVCDYFAGCLLAPRPWLKRAWGDGVQTERALARRFDLSEPAIRVRLSQVGLSQPVRRCDRKVDWPRSLTLGRYQRPLAAATL